MTPEKIVINGKTYKLVPENSNEGATAPMTNSENSMVGGKKSKKTKSGKTRKLSPYMKFAQEARKKVVAEHPEWKSDIVKVGKEIGQMWRGLSEAEKAKY
jgi:hypothetical protein